MNDEAKTRRKTKSKILRKARVMTWEDIKVAQAKRDEKDAAKEAKGKRKRGRKSKSNAQEVKEATTDKRKRKKRKSTTVEVKEPLEASRTHVAEEELEP
jgi:hypothetical protein